MERLPQVTRLPIALNIAPHHLDHRFEGRAVFPAVDTMQVLAETVCRNLPGTDVTGMSDVRFHRFLTVSEKCTTADVFVELHQHQEGKVAATLCTRVTAGHSGITRYKPHGQLIFDRTESPAVPPVDRLATIDGCCFTVSARAVYEELVPFGPAYRNIEEKLLVSSSGALAWLSAPNLPAAGGLPLGSSFPLDAAFHAACVWGQRHHGIVAFPVAIGQRWLFAPTLPGQRYLCRVFAVSVSSTSLFFDIWICDEGGTPFEAALDVEMRDVSGGRWLPPDWIRAGATEPGSAFFGNRAKACCIVELDSVTSAARNALSSVEAERFNNLGRQRQRSFLAARIACKGLARNLSADWRSVPADNIVTASADHPKPLCPPASHCSVAHDSRFAIAVAGETAIGVDVEPVTQRALKTRDIYMSSSEQSLVDATSMEPIQAAIRVWTAKEATAKALGMTLGEAMSQVQVTSIGKGRSRILVQRRGSWMVWHELLENHLFTLFDGAVADG